MVLAMHLLDDSEQNRRFRRLVRGCGRGATPSDRIAESVPADELPAARKANELPAARKTPPPFERILSTPSEGASSSRSANANH
jgi:hypothetical protein